MPRGKIYSEKKPPNTRKDDLKWAGKIINNCTNGLIDLNHPDAIRAANIIGFEKALKIVTQKHHDLLHKRLPGSYESGKRK